MTFWCMFTIITKQQDSLMHLPKPHSRSFKVILNTGADHQMADRRPGTHLQYI